MEVCRSHSEFFFFKSSQNSSKPIRIFWSSIPYVFCLYIHCLKLLVIMIWVFCPCQWWVSKKHKVWMGGRWVGWALSKFFLDFWNFFNFAKPLSVHNDIFKSTLYLTETNARCRAVVLTEETGRPGNYYTHFEVLHTLHIYIYIYIYMTSLRVILWRMDLQ